MNAKQVISAVSLITFLFMFISIQGQTFEEFKKQRQQELQDMKLKQKEFLEKMQKDFDNYVEQRDKEFADYLKKEWEQFNLFKERKPIERPKPDVMPKFKPEDRADEPVGKMPTINKVLEIKSDPARETLLPRVLKADIRLAAEDNYNLNFYGNNLSYSWEENPPVFDNTSISSETISLYFEKLSQTPYSTLIDQLLRDKFQMNLNDWAYYLLTGEVAKTVFQGSENSARLMQWFLMLQSGYKVKVAYSGSRVCLLLPSYQTVYFNRFITLGSQTYYLMNPIEGDQLYTYEKDLPDANRVIDFNIYNALNFTPLEKTKKIDFSYNGQTYPVKVSYNENLIRFYNDYPVVDINVYFNAAMEGQFKESVMESLVPVLNEMNQVQAVSFLLNFVQTAFEYKIDEEQFGREKFFFPVEVFYYPFSDCEDRSALFSYLVSELLDMKSLGLAYTGHVATAVNLNEAVEGDFLVYHNEKYMVADPTYINAPLGMTMPEYRDADAEIIERLNGSYFYAQSEHFWDLAMKANGQRGGSFNDIVLDGEGNAYLAGYISGKAQFGDRIIENPDGKRRMFIVKYNTAGNPEWVDVYGGNGESTGFAVALDDKGFLVVTGSFNGSISPGEADLSLSSGEGKSDIVMAKYNLRGRLLWAKKAGLDQYEQDTYLSYVTWFNSEGVHEKNQLFNENEAFGNFGLKTDPSGKIFFAGAFNRTTGMNYSTASFAEGKAMNPVESLKAENDMLVQQKYERTIAGLFAVTNLMNYAGYKISGRDAQMALDRYNPSFKSRYKSIYENMGKINMIVNNNGIVNIQTSDGSSITIDKVKINPGARIQVSKFDNGDAQITILEGIVVGKMVVWYDLNFVRLYRQSGDMLFDYDSDHTQKVMNLKEDILD
ncbi:MAG: hypothetical protein KKA81_15595 [Bacteroidetes bacterium]|nr:hypothetical protein [Bacteroidota bacterium]